MKKYLILYIFLFPIILCSQTLPSGFKFDKNINISKPVPPVDKSNKINLPIIRSTVTESPILSNFISDIIVAGDTVWFGTGKGVSRTYDKGATFYNYYGSEPFKNDDVSGLAVYKNWVVVSTAYSQKIGETFVPTGSGIKTSSDYGQTWISIPQPTDLQSEDIIHYGANNIHALPITVPEQNLSYDILITRKNLTSDSIVIWIASWAGELRNSVDNGHSFHRVLLPPDDDSVNFITPSGTYNFEYNPRDNAPGNDNHKCFSLSSDNDSIIYVGTAGGINKSTDWGVSWRRYDFKNTGHGIAGNFVVGLKVQKYNGNTILWGATNAGAQRTGDNQSNAVSYTTDGGNTWANTLKDDAVFSHSIGVKDSVVYACTDNGIWRSYFNSGNFTWSKPSTIYDEETRDQIRTNSFYAAGAEGGKMLWVGTQDGLCSIIDTLTAPWIGKWKIYRAVQKLGDISESYAAPNPFSPAQEVCRIYFKTGKPSANVTIKLFDFGMNYVRTVLQNAPRTTDTELWTTWDGRRDDGMQVANGVYFYRIEVDKETTAWGKILVLQ